MTERYSNLRGIRNFIFQNATGSSYKGLHIGTWGEVKERETPDSLGYDFENVSNRGIVSRAADPFLIYTRVYTP